MTFVLVRYQDHLLQCLANKGEIGEEQFKLIAGISFESIVSLRGRLNKTPFPVETATYKTIEFVIESIIVESPSVNLPFQIDDANDYGESFRSDVGQDLRLNHRWLDLRTPVNNALFKMQSGIVNMFRSYLLLESFVELHSPKLIGAASESGASVFELKYFNQIAYLAQSPQLYKQMAINADFDRVFEIGPVFRAEHSLTTRHLCEYVSLDLEMTISPDKSYHEILELMWNLLKYIFNGLRKIYSKELGIVKEKLPFDDLVYPEEPLILEFKDGVKLLKEGGFEQGEFEDLSTKNERELGRIVKEKYGSDLFILDKYPLAARPFYTMPTPDSSGPYSYSYDVIMRGQEISSGSQRINDYGLLLDKVKGAGINPESMRQYLDSFSHGSKRHGGCAFGLERILMLYLNLDNIRKTSFCPRDPFRLTP
jgi:aspartyl-tRNA synthetase